MARRNDQVTKIDKFIGSKLYYLRQKKKLSRRNISDIIGVTQQQLGKYEAGINHISVGRLFLIADAFDKSPEFFYKGLKEYLSDNTDIQTNSVENTNSIMLCRTYRTHTMGIDIEISNSANKKNISKRLITLSSCHNRGSKRDVTKDAFATEESLDLECA